MSWFNEIWEKIIDNKSQFEKKMIFSYEAKIAELKSNLRKETKKNNTIIEDLKISYDDFAKLEQNFSDYIEQNKKETLLEKQWNNKRSKTTVLYNARQTRALDPRIYFNPFDSTIPVVRGNTSDDLAIGSLKLVKKLIKYTKDDGEFWQFAFETLIRKKGDCEDGAILMANIMLKSGVPYWRIRLNAGSVLGGGHAYVTYLAEDNEWYILDWCYWYTGKLNKKWKDSEKYFGIWFSWNTRFMYGEYDKD